jgi:hypothetical protein
MKESENQRGGVISTENLTREELDNLNREQLTELCI